MVLYKHIAVEGQDQVSQDTVKFVQGNFYVNDGLVGVTSDAEAIQLIKEARELCSAGKLRLHKFISNSNNVLTSIPKEECAENVEDLDMALGEPLMERALGVQWCVFSDDLSYCEGTPTNQKRSVIHCSLHLRPVRVCCTIHPPRKTDFTTDVSRQSWLG